MFLYKFSAPKSVTLGNWNCPIFPFDQHNLIKFYTHFFIPATLTVTALDVYIKFCCFILTKIAFNIVDEFCYGSFLAMAVV